MENYQNIQNEKKVISCLMRDINLLNCYKLEEKDFSYKLCKDLYCCIVDMRNDGYTTIVNQVTYGYALDKEIGDYIKKYDGAYRATDNDISDVLNMMLDIGDMSNYTAYYNELKKLSCLRRLKKAGYDMTYYDDEDVEGRVHIEQDSIDDILERYQSTLDNINDSCNHGDTGDFCFADEIPGCNDRYDWIIDGIIKERSFNELVAPSKSGKSQLAYQMAYEVQNGLPFIGLFNTKKCNVYYVDCELDPAEINEREANLRAFEPCNERVRYYSTSQRRTTIDGIIAKIKNAVRKDEKAGFVVLDNFYSFVDGEFDTNSVGEVSDLLSRLKLELTILGVAVLLVNHTNKSVNSNLDDMADGDIDDNFILSSPFGSLAHGAKVDTTILLQKKSQGKKLLITGRKVNPIIRVSCTSDESTNYFFKPLAGNDDDVDKALNRLTDDEIEKIDKLFNGNDVVSLNYLKQNFFGRTLNKELLTNAGYKVKLDKSKNYKVSKK